MHILSPNQEGQIVSLPAWIPGSYMIRDFAKNIVEIKAQTKSGQELNITKLDKQRWMIEQSSEAIHLRYVVYAFDPSVRSAMINDEYAFCNGTSVFLLAEGHSKQACSVQITLPSEVINLWHVATALPADNTDSLLFYANSYADLIDHPILMGEFERFDFTLDGIIFELVFAGGHQSDLARICKDIEIIARHHLDLFEAPYPMQRYVFITLLCDAGFGGLEHRSSTVLQYTRNDLSTLVQDNKIAEGYRNFLSLCSHELLHTWHVKQTKPEEFINLDLSREVYSQQLWIYEGFTSYVDDLSLVRCGLIDAQSYLEVLGQNLTRLERNPGSAKQTVTESSFDAWTRFYQQDASAANTIVSYYTKGAAIALCLDLTLQKLSNGNTSLLDVMVAMWQDYGSVGKGTPIDVVQQLCMQRFNIDVSAFIENLIYSTAPLPCEALLAEVGVNLCKRARIDFNDKGGKSAANSAKVDFGARYKAAPTGVLLTQVLEHSAAYQAGLQVGDNLIAIDHWQISTSTVQSCLDNLQLGTQVTLHVLRDGKLKTWQMPLLPTPLDTVYLETLDTKLRDKWLFAGVN